MQSPSISTNLSLHGDFIEVAFAQAQKAETIGEVPIGAIVVENNQVIAAAHNLKETNQDSVAHAEILALQIAMKVKNSWRLDGCTLYTTLEPCPMCAGAIIHSRIKTVVFGAWDRKWGAAGSLLNLFTTPKLNHLTECIYHPHDNSSKILTHFFKELRKK